jgi:hypothetical protein
MDAGTVIAALGLVPHPEGGHYRETYRHRADDGGRGVTTAIYYLLRDGEVSRWHRVDAVEIWHWYAGAPLALSISAAPPAVETLTLGTDLARGERPQGVVPAHAWQSAGSLGPWTLVGCTVSPAFVFEGFELAPEGWSPAERPSRPLDARLRSGA